MQGYQDEIIVFNQQLFRIQGDKLQELLHRSIGCLTFLNKYKKMSAGSGVLISNDIILTGAHNIYDKQNQCQYTSFKFYIEVNGVAEKYHEIQTWRFPEQFKLCPKLAKLPFDYAIMKLKTPVEFEEYLSLTIPCEVCLPKDQEKQVGVFGFPCGYQNFTPLNEKGTQLKLYQYGLIRQERIVVIDVPNFKIGYGISTLGGQSGCPVTVDNSIIAIHVGGDKGQFNVGRIIDISLIQNIKKWEEELEGTSAVIKSDSNCPHEKKLTIELQMTQLSLESIDLSEYRNLMELNLTDNRLKQIDLSHCPHLTQLNLRSNNLRSLDVTSNARLTYLNLSFNFLQKIDVRANKQLQILSLDYNNIALVDIGENTKLAELWIQSNQLTSINLRNNTELYILRLCKNNLSSIDLTHCQKLNQLYLQENLLTEIDLTRNSLLEVINFEKNRLSEIDLRNNTQLTRFALSSNLLTLIILEITASHLKWADMEHQQSASCRVELRCKEEHRSKAENMCEGLKSQYLEPKYNMHGCAYSFQVVLS